MFCVDVLWILQGRVTGPRVYGFILPSSPLPTLTFAWSDRPEALARRWRPGQFGQALHGMLAFSSAISRCLPLGRAVILSMFADDLLRVVALGVFFFFGSRARKENEVGSGAASAGSVLRMGGAGALQGWHYIGMGAMRYLANCQFNSFLVVCSVRCRRF